MLVPTLCSYNRSIPVAYAHQLVMFARHALTRITALGASILHCKRKYSSITADWCLRLLVAVNKGMLCSRNERVKQEVIVFGTRECCRWSRGA